MFLSVQPRYHIVAHRTGFQDKKLSIEDADHVAFKKLVQRPYNRAVKEGVTNSLLQIAAPAALRRNGLLRCKQFLADPEGIPNDQPGEGSLVIIETPYPGGPRPSLAAPLTKQRYNALLDNGRLSERPVCSRERTFKACRHSR